MTIIKRYHPRHKDIEICQYCNRILNTPYEKKRHICRICYSKYYDKHQTKLSDLK